MKLAGQKSGLLKTVYVVRRPVVVLAYSYCDTEHKSSTPL